MLSSFCFFFLQQKKTNDFFFLLFFSSSFFLWQIEILHSPPIPTRQMRALHARVGSSGAARGQSRRCALSPSVPPPRATQAMPVTNRKRSTPRAFQTSFGDGGGGETQDHDGSNPFVVPIAGQGGGAGDSKSNELRLEERGGRVYARVVMSSGGGGGSNDDDGFAVFPPPPTGVFYAGSELRPACDYLLSPGGAVLTFNSSSSSSSSPSLTVTYEVRDDGGSKGGIGALGEMLARSMMAQSSEEVRAKLDDVF